MKNLKWLVLVWMVVSMGTAARVGCSRAWMMDTKELEYALEGRLPKGPVPPSGPSPCHNMKQDQQQLAHIDDYIMCP